MGVVVLNRHALPGGVLPADAVYVGRPSRWGNPFVIGPDGDRAAVIARYRVWLWRRLREDPDVLAPLVGRRLVCWCAPAPCHAEVLLRALAWRYGEEAGVGRPGPALTGHDRRARTGSALIANEDTARQAAGRRRGCTLCC